MPRIPQLPRRVRNLPRPVLIICAITLLGILAVSMTWMLTGKALTSGMQGNNTGNQPTPGSTGLSIGAHQPVTVNAPASPVSSLVFGTNLGLFDTNDQVLNSTQARSLLKQIHTTIIRMPTRRNLPVSIELQAAQMIKSLGAAPLIILQGPQNPNAMAYNTQIIQGMNTIFGTSTVYYEYSNEEDLKGTDVAQYTSAWNANIPALKKLAPHGHFIGPVNFHYDEQYLISFLKQANPLPDEISWHEYTCDKTWAADVCLSHIDRWSIHIASARYAMQQQIGKVYPIMITEWNYAPNAEYTDGKNADQKFMTTWTTKAIQTLAANRVFAAMQYSATNTTMSLISSSNALTVQGTMFQNQYEQVITRNQQPAPSSVVIQPTAGATTGGGNTGTGGGTTGNGKTFFDFEDGGTDGWSGHGQGQLNIQNSSSVGKNSTHSLQVTLSNTSSKDFPYVAINGSNLSPAPQSGQTVTAYVYAASNAVSINAKLFITDGSYQWHTGNAVTLAPGTWTAVTYTLPTGVTSIKQLGIQFNSQTGSGISTDVYIDAVGW